MNLIKLNIHIKIPWSKVGTRPNSDTAWMKRKIPTEIVEERSSSTILLII